MLDGLLRRRQPLAPLVGLGLGLLGAAGVAGRAGLRRLRLELGHPLAELGHPRVGLGVGAPPLAVDGLADLLLDGRASAPPAAGCRRGAPCRSPPSAPGSLRRAARAASGSQTSIFSASSSSARLAAAFASNSASRSAKFCDRRAKKASCAVRKRCQSASSASFWARPAAFHSVIRSRKRAAVGPQSSESASFSASSASSSLRALAPGALPVQVGEVRAAAAVERLTGLGEPLPQQLVGLAVDAADRAPLVEDRLEPVARLLPLRRLGRQRLGLGGQRLLARDRGGPRARRARRAARPRPARPGPPARRAARAAPRRRRRRAPRPARRAGPSRWTACAWGRRRPPTAGLASSSASVSRSSKRRAKCARPSAGSPACHEPTARSPSAVCT